MKEKAKEGRQAQKFYETNKDLNALPRLSDARRIKTGLPLPTVKHKTLTTKAATTKNSERVSPSPSSRPPVANND